MNTHMFQKSSYNHTKYDGSKEELLILQYNLDDMVQKQYQDMYQYGAITLCWYCPTYYTYYLYLLDAGKGNKTKLWFVVFPL